MAVLYLIRVTPPWLGFWTGSHWPPLIGSPRNLPWSSVPRLPHSPSPVPPQPPTLACSRLPTNPDAHRTPDSPSHSLGAPPPILNLISSSSQLSSNQPRTLSNIIELILGCINLINIFSSPLRFPPITEPSCASGLVSYSTNHSSQSPSRMSRVAQRRPLSFPGQSLTINISLTSVYKQLSSTGPQDVLFSTLSEADQQSFVLDLVSDHLPSLQRCCHISSPGVPST